MITAHDVNTVTFPKAMRGYNADDVDKFLDLVAAQVEADATELAALKKANEEQKENMYLLAQKIDEYRADEENLKSALINAQRMGENIIREAKQKAEGILRDATVRADGIVLDAQQENAEQIIELQRVKAEVAQFKGDVLSLYKRHIESLSTLPEQEEQAAQEEGLESFEEVEIAQLPEEPEQAPAVEDVFSESAPAQAVEPAVVDAAIELEQPVALQLTLQEEQANAFWEQDENELKEATIIPDPAPVFEAFKGIKFSD